MEPVTCNLKLETSFILTIKNNKNDNEENDDEEPLADGVQLVVGQITEGAVVAVDASARTAFPYQQRR